MKEVGLKGAPSDAIEEILEIADFVSTKKVEMEQLESLLNS